jgi:hypothetical protein
MILIIQSHTVFAGNSILLQNPNPDQFFKMLNPDSHQMNVDPQKPVQVIVPLTEGRDAL